MNVRGLVKRIATTPPFEAFVEVMERFPAGRNRLTVLTYHRVVPRAEQHGLPPGLVSATPEEFAAHMAFLASSRRIVDVATLLEARRRGRSLPERCVLLTFDDAYRDFETHAHPVLRRHGFPSILFVPTAFPDSDRRFWWDELFTWLTETDLPRRVATPGGTLTIERRGEAFRRLAGIVKSLPHDEAMAWLASLRNGRRPGATSTREVLGWDGLRRLHDEGVTLAAHSRTHPRLDRLDEAALHGEVFGSRRELEEALGVKVPPVFAYPDGGYDARVLRVVAEAGYEAAFTTRRGGNQLNRADWLQLRRINVGATTPESLVRAQVVKAGLATGRRVAGGWSNLGR